MEKHSTQRSWDIHFMREAKLWAARSKCLSRKIGAVLVKGTHVIATGYNGPPSGVPHCDCRDDTGRYVGEGIILATADGKRVDTCPRKRMGFKSGEGMEHCVAVHAEINPIMQAAKMGISTVGTTLYCYCGTPCHNCAKEIIQAGIKRVVCTFLQKEMKGYNFPLSVQLFNAAGVQLSVITEEEVDNG